MHKYRADGALGSSWHPYLHEDGTTTPPIQEDETALTLFVFSQFYHEHPDKTLLREFYGPMVVPMADFLSNFIDRTTGLPRPSYDLWEEHYATFTYTTAVTYAALLSAARLAEIAGEEQNAVRWRSAAEDIQAASERFFDSEKGYFVRSLHIKKDGGVEIDDTLDVSSFYGSFMFGLFPLGGREVVSAAQSIEKQFSFGKDGYGLPRYQNDSYRRIDESIAGNWWPLVSLWMAQYYLENDDETKAHAVVRWVIDMADGSTLSEQIDPATGKQLSVSPLTWSHAELISTLLDLGAGDKQ